MLIPEQELKLMWWVKLGLPAEQDLVLLAGPTEKQLLELQLLELQTRLLSVVQAHFEPRPLWNFHLFFWPVYSQTVTVLYENTLDIVFFMRRCVW